LSIFPKVWQLRTMAIRPLLAFLLIATVARGDPLSDKARLHLAALGGSARVAALNAMRATGTVVTAGARVRFNLTAARPDRLRMEMDSGGRTKVQAYDGVEAPWEIDTGTWPPRYQPMPENLAKSFMADSEFDDPLVVGAAGGYSFADGGEVTTGGRSFVRIMVTRPLRETYSLLLDADTHLIAMRIEKRQSVSGRALQLVTRFEDYRPVQGVLLAHRITLAVDGKVSQETLIDQIEPIPPPLPEVFARPKALSGAR
jgi:hypothetical protein